METDYSTVNYVLDLFMAFMAGAMTPFAILAISACWYNRKG